MPVRVWEFGGLEAWQYGGCLVVWLSTEMVQLLEKQDNLVWWYESLEVWKYGGCRVILLLIVVSGT
jgi:hypothetical protein